MVPNFIRMYHWTYLPEQNGEKHRRENREKSQSLCVFVMCMRVPSATYAEVRDQLWGGGSQFLPFSLFTQVHSFYFFTFHTLVQSQVPVWFPLFTSHVTTEARIVAVRNHIQLCAHSGDESES